MMSHSHGAKHLAFLIDLMRITIVGLLFITVPCCSAPSLHFQSERHLGLKFDRPGPEYQQLKLENIRHGALYGKHYDVQNSRKFHTDPDASKNLTELISSSGYPVEVYTVETADGFLLDLHRIPHGRREGVKRNNDQPRAVVFLQHALLSSACDWVMNFANDSLGVDLRNLNQSRLDVYFHHSPSGVSVKDMVHFTQLFRKKNFGKYDYGSAELNMAHYNQSTPPQYDVSKVKVPVVAFSASKDWLADPVDVRRLVNTLPNLKAWYLQPTWNHMDFVWGLTAAEGCYPRVLDWLKAYNS